MKKNYSSHFRIYVCILLSIFFTANIFSAETALDYYRTGVDRQDKEEWFGASESFQQAIQVNPSYGDAWFHLAQVTYELKDYSLTLSYLDEAEKFARGRSDILNMRGITLISLGRLKDAREVFENILSKEPNDVDARFGLAQLDLFSGRLDSARLYYQDALKRDSNSRRALLSLALLSEEMGNEETAQAYLNQALRFHSGEAEVHYLAAYLDAKGGDYEEAERRARAAVQIKENYTVAYKLLATILYAQKRYDDVIDICDYLIAQNRSTASAWYLKGLSFMQKKENEKAVSAWSIGLQIDPQDEIMRSALELLVCSSFPLEDSRRSSWALFHVSKAKDYSRRYMSEEERYEYQRALRINPQNTEARAAFASLLENEGLNEQYLNQLKFVQSEKTEAAQMNKSSQEDKSKTKPSYEDTRMSDTIEAYDSLLKSSLGAKWNINPFYLDKTRYYLGIYCVKSNIQLVHPDAESVVSQLAADVFSGVSVTSVQTEQNSVSGYGEAFSLARSAGRDYFIIMSIEETEREITLSADMYSARTGTLVSHMSFFRTGNDRVASAVQAFRASVLSLLPVRGKIVAREGDSILIDLGKTEGIVKDTKMNVVKAGEVFTADRGPGIVWDEKSVLGTLSVNNVGEEISSGILTQNGFYDRVNIGDEVVILSLPSDKAAVDSSAQPAAVADTTPAAGADGKSIFPWRKSAKKAEQKVSAEVQGLSKTPAFVDMIKNIN